MAYIEERYRTISGGEQELVRGFTVHDAISEHEAINLTRTTLTGLQEDFWPKLPGDGTYMGTPGPINTSKFLVDVSVEEVELPDVNRVSTSGVFKTAARYGYRACCPIFDYNLATQNVTVTQALDGVTNPADPDGPKITPPPRTKRYAASGAGNPEDTAGAIEPDTAGGQAKGTQVARPQTQFTMTWNPYAKYATDVDVLRYAQQVHEYVGKVNSGDFLRDSSNGFFGFEAGTLRFDGWTGKLIDQKNDIYEYRYQFTYNSYRTSPANPNEDTIGGITITGGDKYGGFEYLWVRWKPLKRGSANNKLTAPEAKQLNFETVYDQFDFYNLFREHGSPTGTRLVSQACPGFNEFTTP